MQHLYFDANCLTPKSSSVQKPSSACTVCPDRSVVVGAMASAIAACKLRIVPCSIGAASVLYIEGRCKHDGPKLQSLVCGVVYLRYEASKLPMTNLSPQPSMRPFGVCNLQLQFSNPIISMRPFGNHISVYRPSYEHASELSYTRWLSGRFTSNWAGGLRTLESAPPFSEARTMGDREQRA